MSTPIAGPLSVTPLYVTADGRVVFWDGVVWQELTLSGSTGPVFLTDDAGNILTDDAGNPLTAC